MARDNNNRDDLNLNQDDEQVGGRGFGGMNPKKRKDAASRGGKAAHEKGTAHEWDSNEAKEAGRKGGQASGGGGGEIDKDVGRGGRTLTDDEIPQ